MFGLVHEAGFSGWMCLLLSIAGLVLTFTVGRRIQRPGSVAAAFAVAILAQGAIGLGLGQRNVDAAVMATDAANLASRVEIVSIGTREASANLLLSGACATLLLLAGAGLLAGSGSLRRTA